MLRSAHEILASTEALRGMGERQVWLVKVPTFLGKRWRSACDESKSKEAGPELGSIQQVSAIEGEPPTLRLKLSDTGGENIPVLYNLKNSTADIAGLHAFIQGSQQADLLGAASQRMDAEILHDSQAGTTTGVQLDASYRALTQQRHQQANERTRTAQQVDAQDILNAQRNARLREPASMRSAIKRNTEARNARANQIKLDSDQLERLLFQLFERKPSWKMNDLRAETRQSVESIKKILENIAVQNTRGPSRGEFELKSEYKTSTPAV
ncbi:hypothetical protein WJX79_001848 [Trebouxia sp. C0005]